MLDNGRFRKTGNPYDMAIRGPGFFEVKTAQGLRYTRNGEFHLDGHRRFVTEMGDPVMGQRGEIKLATEGPVEVSPDGAIQVNGQEADKIKVVEFLDSSPPQKSENGLFAGDRPKPSKDAVVEAGYVEESNVNALTEMVKLIQGMRMYESAQKLIQAFDHMTELAVQDVGKGDRGLRGSLSESAGASRGCQRRIYDSSDVDGGDGNDCAAAQCRYDRP